ncbi:MAG: M1 family metallopeptidase [Flavobacteriaceae bacterium]|nr:M1 family metallopeptidase [Flavobacteriaceae bacterium]
MSFKKLSIVFLMLLLSLSILAQESLGKQKGNPGYWQQRVHYKMDIDVDVKKYQYTGTQELQYTNNSPDILSNVFYHLYFNAFQPGSEMDSRLQQVIDPDKRMVINKGTEEAPDYESKISVLKPNEIGYIKVFSLTQNGSAVSFKVEGTVLEVSLSTPILPGETVTFDMKFKGQIPLLIRRSGRNSSEGVALTMSQWYPKIAEYDYQGWQAHAYIAREFQGVFGDFDVTLHIDKKYTVAASGYLQNPQEVGHGYEDITKPIFKNKQKKLTWRFSAPNVHDFSWAADPNYIHDKLVVDADCTLHFFYKKSLKKKYRKNWKELQPKAVEIMRYFNQHIGAYPYRQYSIVQGGDGGMEYAMLTMITGKRSLGSLAGITAHEMAHTWFQQVLATNESTTPWMDEGFTDYISDKCIYQLFNKDPKILFRSAYQSYDYLANSHYQEPLTTHGDRYDTNMAYGIASYSMGTLFLSQLEYIIGAENVATSLKKYFDDFKFTHPTPNDFKRVAEKVSGIQLEWYLNEWTQTTHKIDYAVVSVMERRVHLKRIGTMPMPIDLTVQYTDGTSENYYIPLRMMRGEKQTKATQLKDWAWAMPNYTFTASKIIKSITIDPLEKTADINRVNNVFSF